MVRLVIGSSKWRVFTPTFATPDGSHLAHTETLFKYHIRRAHTKKLSLVCPAKKHPVEWGEADELQVDEVFSQ